MRKNPERIMILGGSGVIGFQIARKLARELEPKVIFIVTLHQSTMREALQHLREEFPKVTFDGSWGNIFLRSKWRGRGIEDIRQHPELLNELVRDLFGPRERAGEKNLLGELVRNHKPDVLIDAVSTANSFALHRDGLAEIEVAAALAAQRQSGSAKKALNLPTTVANDIEQILVNQAIPHLIHHVRILKDAMKVAGTRIYLKVGTTGTGGMGFNIPYTYSDDKPSAKQMARVAIAFAHTGLLFSLARTPGAPAIREIKPAALIGSRKIEYRNVEKGGERQPLYHAKKSTLGKTIHLSSDVGYAQRGELAMVGISAGVSGFFTLGEFETITTLNQMEYITPEEVAEIVRLEIQGVATGHDIISAVDAAVINPTYRAGMLRGAILAEMQRLVEQHQAPSIALGQLGPPELSKLLYEAWLIKSRFPRLDDLLTLEAGEISRMLESYLLHHPVRHTIVSIGIPILLADGQTLLRGPHIKIPQYNGVIELAVTPTALDSWAAKGWVDLRPTNMERWQQRVRQMQESWLTFFDIDSSDLELGPLPSRDMAIGEMVGWIFNNDPAIAGYRIKAL